SPGLLLLDEPLSALDARVRLRLRHEIKALQRRLGVTTIMVTHDQEEALTMADRIVVMNHGVVEQVGTPTEIYHRPASAFVADFVGPMNFLQGELVAPGRVSVDGIELSYVDAAARNGHSRVRICLRPEDVRVRDLGEDRINRLTVDIVDLEFIGAFCRATLRLPQSQRSLIADFSSNLMRDYNLEAAKRLDVILPPDRLRVFVED